PGILVIDPKAGRPVVPHPALQEQLIPQVEGGLGEVSLSPNLGLDVLGRRKGGGVAQVERLIGDQPVADLALLPEAPGVEVLADTERSLHLLAQRVAGSRQEIAVPLGVDQRLLDNLAPRVGRVGARWWLALEPTVLTVVYTQRVAQLEPVPRGE